MRRQTAGNDDARGTGPATGRLDRFFRITERGSTTGRELRGGLVTFFAMAYIVILNPSSSAGRAPRTRPSTSRAGGSRRRRSAR